MTIKKGRIAFVISDCDVELGEVIIVYVYPSNDGRLVRNQFTEPNIIWDDGND
jgi:hypothetical protein